MDDGFIPANLDALPGPAGGSLDTLVEGLASDGFAHRTGALPAALWRALREEALLLHRRDDFEEAGIGRGEKHRTARRIRRTRISWLDGSTPAQAAFLGLAEDLRLAINRALFLGLFEFEAHFAHYPPGGFYARHLDAFRQERSAAPNAGLGKQASRSRVVSLVAFLNEDWTAEDGGELVLWRDVPHRDGVARFEVLDTEPPALVTAPRGGDLVLMLSEQVPHEVLETRRDRFAIAGWFRVNASVGGVVDPML